MEIQLTSPHIFWYALITLIGLAAGVLSYRRSFPPLGRYQRIFMASLRVIMIILLGIFLVEPLINLYSTLTVKPQLAVLMDTSRSMSVKDDAASRISVADQLAGEALAKIKSEYDVFAFSDRLRETNGLPEESEIAGEATSISNALNDLGSRGDLEKYGAAIIISDGRQNLGEDPLTAASKLGMPVYSLTLGRAVAEKNLAIDNVIYPAIAYSGVDFKVEAELSASGLPAAKSRISIKLSSQMLADKPFDIPQEGRQAKIEFDIKASEPGNYEYSISTPVLDGEDNRVDNERLFAVRVLKNKIRIFLGAPSLDWEFKFIKQALSRFDEFDVDAVYPGTTGGFTEPGTPRGLDGLKAYDAVIMINSAPAALRISPIDLKKYVDEGGALIYLGGAGSTGDIKLYDGLLPLKADRPYILEGEYFIEPSPTQKQHAAIMLDEDPDQSVRIWHSLPPLKSLLTDYEATGQVLLEVSSGRRDSTRAPRLKAPAPITDVRPVLIVSKYGRGRVAALTAFPWWRPYFGAVRDGLAGTAVPDFWRNLLKWASATDQLENFKVITDRKVYRFGEPVRATGYLYDESNRPRNGAYVSLSFFPQGDETSVKDVVLPPADNGIYSEAISALGPGKYEFTATASAYGDTLGRTGGSFTIENFSLEMASSSPDYDLTRRIAEATGGKAYTADDFNLFPEQLKLEPYTKEKQAVIRPFGTPALVIILLAGLCLEWGLRKRFRLP